MLALSRKIISFYLVFILTVHSSQAWTSPGRCPSLHQMSVLGQYFSLQLKSATFSSCKRYPLVRTMAQNDAQDDPIEDRSTLSLLEHVNLNVPSQDSILPFFFELLKCGMDPRKAENLRPDAKKKTLWANCGASQFHLPFGEEAQRISGQIGLQYDSLGPLYDRLTKLASLSEGGVQEWSEERTENGELKSIRIVNCYGNTFLCRAGGNPVSDPGCQQPCITTSQHDVETWGEEIVHKYGSSEPPECRGIDFVEFWCPRGTAKGIAQFYDDVFEATTTVLTDETDSQNKVAIVAIGNIRASGRADQSLLFRETDNNTKLLSYDGHHIAVYVGDKAEDFDRAFENAEAAGVVWVNPRFSDKATTLDKAREYQQFRFKNIIDLETKKTIFELEHEFRSVEHDSWPGTKKVKDDMHMIR